MGKKIPSTNESKPKLIIRGGVPNFRKNDYPPAK